MDIQQKEFQQLIQRVEELKKSGTVDLSTEEDLSLAIMNLVSLEEHFFFTAEKTGKKEYFNILDEVRAVRKNLLAKLISEHEGETWCISKHLLGAAMRLMEVGTKLHSEKKTQEADEIFSYSYKLYSLFWALRLKLLDTSGLKKIAKEDQAWTLEDIVNKLVDCCDE